MRNRSTVTKVVVHPLNFPERKFLISFVDTRSKEKSRNLVEHDVSQKKTWLISFAETTIVFVVPEMRQSSLHIRYNELSDIKNRAGTLVHTLMRNDRAKVTVSQVATIPPTLYAPPARFVSDTRIRGLMRKQTTSSITREARSMHLTPQWRKTWMSYEKRPDYRSLHSRCMWAVRNSPVPSNGWKKVTVMNYFAYFYAPRPLSGYR